MISNDLILIASKWVGISTLVFAVLTVLSFILKWGFRFRLVGITSFMAVLTGGLFALGVSLYVRTPIPGAVKFSLVYDDAATQAVIAVPATITESELEATLRQAAADLYSPGRFARNGENQLTVRARTLLHPEPGISELVYLGEVKRSLRVRNDEQIELQIYPDKMALVSKAQKS
jgi:Protein of function (DUF2518)